MQKWIAFLRGINVGGKNLLPMRRLVTLLEELGCTQITTYLQSGNVVFRSRKRSAATVAEKIGRAVESSQGFRPQVLVLTAEELESVVAANPFPAATVEPKTLHVFLLAGKPENADLSELERIREPSEEFQLTPAAFYLHAPNGIGRSKLAANAERLIGESATARNWRTVQKVLELARELP